MNEFTHQLSKSTFIKGLQCDKHLYLYKHHYNWQDKISEMQQANFDRGHRIGALAQQLFPGGLDASPPNPRKYIVSIEKTQNYIKQGADVIYEAAFIYNGVLIYADILVKEKSKWKVYEVKSSTSVSETNKYDAGIQYYVISNSGLDIADISIVYINNQYVREGELDLHQLFAIESVLDFALGKQKWIDDEVERQKQIIKQKNIPDIDIGMQCYDPYTCAFLGHCWDLIPEDSVFEISGMHLKKKVELYEDGIISIADIPEDINLPEKQQLQVDCFQTNETIIDKPALDEFLKTINYPLYFMDFETFQPAVPLWNNSKPYQQIPFQYSLHYQETPDSQQKHFEFLAEVGPDPRIPFIKKLLEATKGEGDILVYNQSFEKMILNVLSLNFSVYEEEIEERISRIKDLMIPFQKKWYYTPEMKGSYSIKAVLPALVPEMNYQGLDIAEGTSASLAYENLFDEKDMFKAEETKNNLLEYCKLDTLAMVRILEKLITGKTV